MANRAPALPCPAIRFSNLKRPQDRRGAAAVEFAVTFLVLLMLAFGAIEMSRVVMLRHSADHAACIAARHGIISGVSADDIRTTAQKHLSLLGISSAKISVIPSTISDSTPAVEVVIDVPVAANSWATPNFYKGAVTGRAKMLTERFSAVMATSLPTPPPPPRPDPPKIDVSDSPPVVSRPSPPKPYVPPPPPPTI